MNDITTIDTNNYAEMAKAMGLANEAPAQKETRHVPCSTAHQPLTNPWFRYHQG